MLGYPDDWLKGIPARHAANEEEWAAALAELSCDCP
jgi:hypothetical protein